MWLETTCTTSAEIRAGDYGIFLKGATSDGVIERNLVICGRDRANFGAEVGISFGGGGTGFEFCPGQDCSCEDFDSVARNNIIINCTDSGMHTKRACGSKFYNNLVYNTGAGLQIQENGAGAPVDVQNNVMSHHLVGQNNVTQANNLFDVPFGTFAAVYADIDGADLTDGPNPSAFSNQGASLAEVTDDYCGAPRVGATDFGPIEFPAACATWPWPSGPVGPRPDAGVPPDAGANPDAGGGPDVGIGADAGANVDAGSMPPPDAGFTEAGVPVDVGSAPDTGVRRADSGGGRADDGGGGGGGNPRDDGGCSCASSSRGPGGDLLFGLLFLGAALVFRRRS